MSKDPEDSMSPIKSSKHTSRSKPELHMVSATLSQRSKLDGINCAPHI